MAGLSILVHNLVLHPELKQMIYSKALFGQQLCESYSYKNDNLNFTSFVLSLARAWARWALKVLFPTPPFPDRTRILCLTDDSFSPISAMAVVTEGQKQQQVKLSSQNKFNKRQLQFMQIFKMLYLKVTQLVRHNVATFILQTRQTDCCWGT